MRLYRALKFKYQIVFFINFDIEITYYDELKDFLIVELFN